MSNSLTISQKLALGFSAVIALLLVLAGVAYVNVIRLSDAVRWNNHTYEVIREGQSMLEHMLNVQTGARGYLLTADERFLEPFRLGRESVLRHYERIRTLTADNPVQQQRLAKIYQLQGELIGFSQQLIDLRRAAQRDLRKQQAVTAMVAAGRGKELMDAFRKEVGDFTDTEQALLGTRQADVKEREQATRLILSLGCALAIVLAGLIAWAIIRGLSRQLGGEPAYASEVARRIAQGDFSHPVTLRRDDRDSLLAHMAQMQDGLSRLIARIKQAAEAINVGAQEIAMGNNDLSRRTEQQAAALEETASSMEELTVTVKQNADSARQGKTVAEHASGVAGRGGEVMQQVVHTMGSITDSSRKIVDIIGVIDTIAFQTNILALNAAVEAARAGEQGRGFAVVAGEVRTLAQRSAAAAKEIKGLIGASVDKVEGGNRLVESAGQTIHEVVVAIHRVTELMNDVSDASYEQSNGIQQVNTTVIQMDEVTQQNAALVEEVASASESLAQQSRALADAVSRFRLPDGLAVAPAAAPVARPAMHAAHLAPLTQRRREAAAAVELPKRAQPADEDWTEF
ncbi:methyl-accepting chemotaxis protein [Chitinimonas koreensis]|uniref:methyl-accepting chemotaxis protein n=1 Tax=Chitinimonas koreensis TaxID=356302 RepID=UPI00040302D4|nr:methyl-accepting chemotaxis protein [Chitinimonas koreensis]QNM98130.1 CHASE3 domain-containing protein [Chitinimonas koreensis]